jgi:hypothetical protein
MLVTAIVAVSAMQLGQFETRIGVNHSNEVRAVQAAEAGARLVFRQFANSSQTTQQWLDMAQPIHNLVPIHAAGTARYTVSIVDNNDDGNPATDSDGVVMIRSEGASGAGGSRVAVGLLVSGNGPFVALDGVRVANSLGISGNPIVQGQSAPCTCRCPRGSSGQR